ncbi:hypothetical protein EST38_g4030 [Candolleomyces aberdarensis]|uniref:Uncharacterized protein n=1 Tax=Candolleomyces aberdarensis TaxID=2316362 RepID=A0A4Q2DSC7_9AGAR|nr:hypothetical protein EST38_g4030 [Candolleomyces aberdarensis]
MLWAARRTRFLVTLAIVCVVLLSIYSLSNHPTALRRFRQSDDSDSDADKTNATYLPDADNDSSSLPSTTLCQGDDCFSGSWTRRKHPFTRIEELKPWTGCPAGTQESEGEQERADAKRLLEVNNWVWTPKSGVLKEWDAEAFVVRLLKSSGGLILVGDEISEHYFNSLVVLLRKAGITLDIGTSDYPHVIPYILKADDGERLAKSAGVPASRAKRPLLTYIEEGFLLSMEDLKSIASRVGAITDYANWQSPLPQADGWPNYVKEAVAAEKGEHDTVLLMNTGIYWSRQYLTILKPRNRPTDEQNRLTEAYRQMVRTISNQLKDVGGLSIYYRATAPGHPNCAMRSSPYRNGKVAETFEDDVVGRLMRPVKTDAEQGDAETGEGEDVDDGEASAWPEEEEDVQVALY